MPRVHRAQPHSVLRGRLARAHGDGSSPGRVGTMAPTDPLTDHWQLDYETPLLSINRERTMHWAPRAAYIAQVRGDFKLLALAEKIPHLARCRIVAQPWQKRGPLADHGNHYPTIKAALYELVDARVVPNDA